MALVIDGSESEGVDDDRRQADSDPQPPVATGNNRPRLCKNVLSAES